MIILSSLMALATRFEFDVRQIPEEFFSVLLDYGVLMIFVTLIVFGVFRIYSSLWEYAGLEETFKIIGAVVFSSLCDMAIVVGMGKHLPRSYYVIRTFYLIALVGGSRFFYRLIRLRYRKRQHYSIKKKKKIMLIGAGEAGRTLIQEIQNSRYLDQKICCVIDDNRRKIGRYILGIRVVGDRNAIKRSVEHYGMKAGRIRCRAGTSTFWITWDGYMTPCGMMPEPEVDMQELDFTEAWRNLLEVSSKLHTSSVCEKCPNQSMCHSCAAMAYAETGMTSEVPTYLCKMIDAMKKLADKELISRDG